MHNFQDNSLASFDILFSMKNKNLGLNGRGELLQLVCVEKAGVFVTFVLGPSNGKYTFKYIFYILALIKKKLP